MDTKTVLIHFPLPLRAALVKYARDHKVTLSALFRAIAADWLEKNTGERFAIEVEPVGRPLND